MRRCGKHGADVLLLLWGRKSAIKLASDQSSKRTRCLDGSCKVHAGHNNTVGEKGNVVLRDRKMQGEEMDSSEPSAGRV